MYSFSRVNPRYGAETDERAVRRTCTSLFCGPLRLVSSPSLPICPSFFISLPLFFPPLPIACCCRPTLSSSLLLPPLFPPLPLALLFCLSPLSSLSFCFSSPARTFCLSCLRSLPRSATLSRLFLFLLLLRLFFSLPISRPNRRFLFLPLRSFSHIRIPIVCTSLSGMLLACGARRRRIRMRGCSTSRTFVPSSPSDGHSWSELTPRSLPFSDVVNKNKKVNEAPEEAGFLADRPVAAGTCTSSPAVDTVFAVRLLPLVRWHAYPSSC